MAKPKRWLDAPADEDYLGAANYLSLVFSGAETSVIVDRLRSAAPSWRKAKDLLRASRLELLPPEDPDVAKDLKRAAKGKRLSPVLLVRTGGAGALIVADGYHRICAAYHLDEDAAIACRLVDPR